MITAVSPTSATVAQQYLKFHQLHQQQHHQHNHQSPSSAPYKSQSTHGGSAAVQRQSITIVDAPSQIASTSASNSKRKRSWSRAVFSQLQRKGLEIQFQIQKYITKPDRRKLAARLGLTDAQVTCSSIILVCQTANLNNFSKGESLVPKSTHEMATYT